MSTCRTHSDATVQVELAEFAANFVTSVIHRRVNMELAALTASLDPFVTVLPDTQVAAAAADTSATSGSMTGCCLEVLPLAGNSMSNLKLQRIGSG